jgi:hypothetical protein
MAMQLHKTQKWIRIWRLPRGWFVQFTLAGKPPGGWRYRLSCPQEHSRRGATTADVRSRNICLRSAVYEGMALDNTTAFANYDPLIGVHTRDGLDFAHNAIWPADR